MATDSEVPVDRAARLAAGTEWGHVLVQAANAAAALVLLGGSGGADDDSGLEAADSDLDAIAALSTTTYGRSFLALADAAAARTALQLGTAATTAATAYDTAGAAAAAQSASQPVDTDLTAVAALATTTFGRGFLALADAAAGRTTLGLGSIATHATTEFDASGAAAAAQAADQPLDSDLTALAALVATTDSFVQAKASAWAARTIAQVKVDLGLPAAAPPGSWDAVASVTGSDATTGGQSLVDITGLSAALLANHVYEFEAAMLVTTSADLTGIQFGVQFSGAGASVAATQLAPTTNLLGTVTQIVSLNTVGIAKLTSSGETGMVVIKGFLTTGANAGNLTIQHLKVTSGLSTVRKGSALKVRLVV